MYSKGDGWDEAHASIPTRPLINRVQTVVKILPGDCSISIAVHVFDIRRQSFAADLKSSRVNLVSA